MGKNIGYNDNGNFVIVFEDCKDDLKRYLINQYKVQLIGDFNAKPVKNIDVNANLPEFNKETKKVNFNKEIYNEFNKSINILLNNKWFSELTDDAMASVSSFIVNGDVSLNPETKELLNNYLNNRFSGKDPGELVNMLNMIQCDNFVKIFGAAMTSVFIDNNITQKTFMGLNLEEKRKYIESGIRYFQNNNVF